MVKSELTPPGAPRAVLHNLVPPLLEIWRNHSPQRYTLSFKMGNKDNADWLEVTLENIYQLPSGFKVRVVEVVSDSVLSVEYYTSHANAQPTNTGTIVLNALNQLVPLARNIIFYLLDGIKTQPRR